jgi:hypothetical protein
MQCGKDCNGIGKDPPALCGISKDPQAFLWSAALLWQHDLLTENADQLAHTWLLTAAVGQKAMRLMRVDG